MGGSELESNCNALANLFQGLINDMRDSVPVFEELSVRTTKLHSSLRSSIVAIAGFLESFQKVADAATGSKGATKEIGKSLTRLCLRHRSIESKMKVYANSLLEELAVPLQERLEDWKRNTVTIDKDHAKDYKKVRGDIKRASSDTLKLQKKSRKGKTTYCKGDAREQLESAMLGVTDKYKALENMEKSYVRKALVEERKHFCDFICFLRPVVDSEMAMVNEVAHLQEIVDHLSALAADPDTLPESSEQVINDLKDSAYSYKPKTPPDSPTSDRHSLSSSINSLVSATESDVTSQRSSSPATRLQAQKSSNINCSLSAASQDSGFTSQDALFGRSAVHTGSHIGSRSDSTKQQRSHGSLEEEKSDSLSVYSSISQGSRGSNDFDSGSAHSLPTNSLQRQHLDRSNSLVSRASGEIMGPPPRPQRLSSIDSSASSTTSQSIRRNSTTNTRSSVPPRTRAKPKPVAMPSVPFMETEPIYMNTHELAAKIAAKRKEEAAETVGTPSVKVIDSVSAAANMRPPTTKDEEIRAQNDALADAIKELEASTAALNDCLGEPSGRRSVVSSSGYGTTTSNSSASEEVQLVTHDTPYSIHTKQVHAAKSASLDTSQTRKPSSLHQHIPPSPVFQQPAYQSTPGKHVNELEREATGVEVVNWAGKALMRHPPGHTKPPPPVRRSSSVSSSINGSVVDRPTSQHSSKPPLLSPKPRLSAVDGKNNGRSSVPFPSPPPPAILHHDDEDPYAVPLPCHPVDPAVLPPPPEEFGADTRPDSSLPFNISDLPPPLPHSPAPPYLTSQVSPAPPYSVSHHGTPLPPPSHTASTLHPTPVPHYQQHTNPTVPWQPGPRSPKLNSKGVVPPPTLSKKGSKINTNFLAQLNSTLGGTSEGPPAPPSSQRPLPAAVDSLRNSRAGTSAPRNTLLSQIHSGVRLKKTVNVNDRSAPSL